MRQQEAMRYLDLDLDYFLDWMPGKAPTGQRARGFKPSSPAHVRRFLTAQCGLSASSKLPGTFVVHHDEAFDHWLERRHKDLAAFPIEVVHVDSHADLGCGECAWVHLAVDVLHRPLEERANVEHREGMLTPGSYLAYAGACRWIASLEYVHHPKGLGDDIDRTLLGEKDLESDTLELKAFTRSDIDAFLDGRRNALRSPVSREPPIPIRRVNGREWKSSAPFDRAILCHSPDYTPTESDALLPIFWEYIDFGCEPPC